MGCRTFRKNILLSLYGELGEEDTENLRQHVAECARCARELEETRKITALLDATFSGDAPHPDWEKNWEAVKAGMDRKEGKRPVFLSFPRWAYTAAALMLMFGIGLFMGRGVFSPSRPGAVSLVDTASVPPPLLQDHLESLKQVLTAYANYDPADPAGEKIAVDKEIIRNLLIQNILLQRMMAGKNPSWEQILEDADMVLREIANTGEDSRAFSSIRDLIRKQGILFEIEVSKTI